MRVRGAYSRTELEQMVREAQALHRYQDELEARRSPRAFALRAQADDIFRQVPLGEGRDRLNVLRSVRESLTRFIDSGTDLPETDATDVMQTLIVCQHS